MTGDALPVENSSLGGVRRETWGAAKALPAIAAATAKERRVRRATIR
jgi:hypothetical protein